MNTAINRGYSPDVLNPEGKVYVFASSCSPVVIAATITRLSLLATRSYAIRP
jgi:hypothetical protein